MRGAAARHGSASPGRDGAVVPGSGKSVRPVLLRLRLRAARSAVREFALLPQNPAVRSLNACPPPAVCAGWRPWVSTAPCEGGKGGEPWRPAVGEEEGGTSGFL